MGVQHSFALDVTELVGANVHAFTINTIRQGVLPENFQSFSVPGHTFQTDLSFLRTGVEYYAQVRSQSKLRQSLPTFSKPRFLAPGGAPGIPKQPILTVKDSNTIVPTYEQQATDNGAEISSYIIEVDPSPSFEDAIVVEKDVR